jgi:D-alanyl-D-alanine carboxypeptidase
VQHLRGNGNLGSASWSMLSEEGYVTSANQKSVQMQLPVVAARASNSKTVRAIALACAAVFFAGLMPAIADAAPKKKAKKAKTRVQSAREVRDITAALIVDADTGRVLYAEDATEQRYPASLTKMMTLYLLFDAVKSGQVKLNEKMPVSQFAASRPATNLSMQAGDRLTVEDAIRALVVRSANDAAVVVAERLGGSEEAFAQKMTAKARELGMTSTTFKNASGLPNKEQKTSARDMAMLGMALKQHHAQYYHYFKTTQFTHNGRTYKTHNRVLLNYPGADGLKTGFINASGFNVVSSVKRNNKHLIGVVMGGSSGAQRDQRMMSLFDRALGVSGQPFRTVDARPAIQASSAKQMAEVSPFKPVPKNKPHPEADNTARVLAASVNKAQQVTPFAPAGHVQMAALGHNDAMALAATATPTRPADAGWGIQVGAFAGKNDAMAALREAKASLPRQLSHAEAMVPQPQAGGDNVHRARLGNLSEQEARVACKTLVQQNRPCFVFQAN